MALSRNIKACLFDMDGTLLNTEELYTEAATNVLAKFGKGPLTWDVKIRLQGLPGPEATQVIIKEYDIPCSSAEFAKLTLEAQESLWSKTDFLPGALDLLKYLDQNHIPIALGTSSDSMKFDRKTKHLDHGFQLFRNHVVTGDDPRIPPGKGKPNPDIWYACLKSLNDERRTNGHSEIRMEDCLIFEDGIPGVISGIAAEAYVIWIPDKNALLQLKGKENEIIGNSGEILSSLEDFDKARFNLNREI